MAIRYQPLYAQGGATAEVVRDALSRCVNAISATAARAAAAKGGERKPDESADAAAELASRLDTSEDDADQAALAAAAAAVLRGPALHLLSAQQLLEAAGALAACISAGLGGPEVFAALSVVVRHGPTGQACPAAAEAVVQCPGALAALLEAFAELTGASRSAFSCLTDTIESLSGGGDVGTVTPPLQSRHIQALLRLVQSDSSDASVALRCLLMLIRLSAGAATSGSGSGCSQPAVMAVAAEVRAQHGAAAALLAAANGLLGDSSVADFKDGSCAVSLFHLTAKLLAERELTVEQLRELAPGLTDAAVGVLAGKWPSDTWSGLFTSLAERQCDRTHYLAEVAEAAAKLSFYLLHLAEGRREDGDAAKEETATAWLIPDEVADALVQRVLNVSGEGCTALTALGQWGVRCLTLSLQLSPPAGGWHKYPFRCAA